MDLTCARLSGKTAIVTGAGSGMGKAIATMYAKEGANVLLADINEERVEQARAEIEELGGSAVAMKVNVAECSEVEAMIDKAIAEFGQLDILVNNAGIMDNFSPIDELTDEMWERVMAVNVSSIIYSTRKAIPLFRAQGSGVIINIASVGGLYGARAGVAYTASKHAVVGITKNTAVMYARNGIRCNAIAPGAIDTNIGESIGQNISQFGMAVMSATTKLIPSTGSAEQVARVAVALGEDSMDYINGVVIPVDAGWTAY